MTNQATVLSPETSPREIADAPPWPREESAFRSAVQDQPSDAGSASEEPSLTARGRKVLQILNETFDALLIGKDALGRNADEQ